ncbi:hypothetical protein QQF64_002189 [Cirrhinus molitorella]|uniref:Uncharacterized protein n=1 Tax=Cirrhinus molitorella TaxID=172907 RepID=A0ABR3MPH6_9TELE
MRCSQSVPDALTSSKIHLTGKTYFFSRFLEYGKSIRSLTAHSVRFPSQPLPSTLPFDVNERIYYSRVYGRPSRGSSPPPSLTIFSTYPHWGNSTLKGPDA